MYALLRVPSAAGPCVVLSRFEEEASARAARQAESEARKAIWLAEEAQVRSLCDMFSFQGLGYVPGRICVYIWKSVSSAKVAHIRHSITYMQYVKIQIHRRFPD